MAQPHARATPAPARPQRRHRQSQLARLTRLPTCPAPAPTGSGTAPFSTWSSPMPRRTPTTRAEPCCTMEPSTGFTCSSRIPTIHCTSSVSTPRTGQYEYGHQSIPELKLTNIPDDADTSRFAMLHDGSTYRLYFRARSNTFTMYQFG